MSPPYSSVRCSWLLVGCPSGCTTDERRVKHDENCQGGKKAVALSHCLGIDCWICSTESKSVHLAERETSVRRQVPPPWAPWADACCHAIEYPMQAPTWEGTAYCGTPGGFVTARSCMQRPSTSVSGLPYYYLYRLHTAHGTTALPPPPTRLAFS